MCAAIIGAVAGLAGVVLGWLLNSRTGERHAIRQRQDAAAATLDEEIIKTENRTPRTLARREDAREALREALTMLREAWQRAAILHGVPDLDRRVNAFDQALFSAFSEAAHPGDNVNYWPLQVAIRDLRAALTAYQQHRDPPDAEFPSQQQLVQLTHPGGINVGIEGVRQHLLDKGVTS